MSKVQNNKPAVENVEDTISKTRNKVVKAATQKIFESLVNLESLNTLSEIITDNFSNALTHASFMTEQLELTQEQKEKLLSLTKITVKKSKDQYLEEISKRKRAEEITEIVEEKMHLLIEEMLSSLAQEVNRGALINSVAVAADCKSDKHNKIELHYSKNAGDITIPTQCFLIPTNCLEIIKHSIKVDEVKANDKE